MKTYRLSYWSNIDTGITIWRIWKHTGPLMGREVHCIYRDTGEKTARAVLRDLEKQK